MSVRTHGHKWRALCIEAKRTYHPTCWICGNAIDMTLHHHHKDSWTLDHLDPVGVGGAVVPSIDRVRPAHRGCNSIRGITKYNPTPSPRSEAW